MYFLLLLGFAAFAAQGCRGQALVQNELTSVIIEDAQLDEVENIFNELAKSGISPEVLFKVKSDKSVILRSYLKAGGLSEWMQKQIESEYTIDIEVAFRLLSKVGQLLRIAHAGCKGFSCAVKVVAVHSQYLTMIHESQRVSSYFVRNSKKAIRYHGVALKNLEKTRFASAQRYLKRAAKIADELVEKSAQMVNLSERLSALTEEALVETERNDNTNNDEILKTEAARAKSRARVNQIRSMLDQLTKRESEIMESVGKLEKEVESLEVDLKREKNKKIGTRDVCTAIAVNRPSVSIIGFGINTGQKVVKTCHKKLDEGAVTAYQERIRSLDGHLKNTRDERLALLAMKLNTQVNMSMLYGELAASLTNVNFTLGKTNALMNARKSLQIAQDTLAVVKVIFLNTLTFWKRLSGSAMEKGSTGDRATEIALLKPDELEEFEEYVRESGLHWLAMGKVAVLSNNAMRAVKANVTDTFIAMPSHSQKEQILQASGTILSKTRWMIKKLGRRTAITAEQYMSAQKAIEVDRQKITDASNTTVSAAVASTTVPSASTMKLSDAS